MSITTEAPAPPRLAHRRGGWRGALALSRIEGRRLLLHPLMLAFTALSVVAPGMWWGGFKNSLLASTAIDWQILVWPLAGGTLIASNLAVRRPIRDGTDETFDAASLSQHTRTFGHLIAVLWVVAMATALGVALLVMQAASGGVGPVPLAEFATGSVLVAGAGALGVLTARWIPGFGGWFAGLAAVLFAEMAIGGTVPESSRLRWLMPFVPNDQYLPLELTLRDARWHLVYLTGVVGVIGVLALLRGGAGRRLAIGAACCVLLATTGGVGQTRQISPDQARMLASRATAPRPCVDRNGVSYCLWRTEVSYLERWAGPVEGVLAHVPPGVKDRGLVVRQLPGPFTLRALPAEVRAFFAPGAPNREPWLWPGDGDIRIDARLGEPSASASELKFNLALKTASWAVGLSLEPPAFVPDEREASLLLKHPIRVGEDAGGAGRPTALPCNAAGQARAVIALWLTGRGEPAAALSTFSGGAPGNDLSDDGVSHRDGIDAVPLDTDELLFIEPPLWGADIPSAVLWASSDLRYARRLLGRPADGVTATIGANWETLTDPRTPTATLVRLLDLEPLTASQTTLPYEPVEPTCR